MREIACGVCGSSSYAHLYRAWDRRKRDRFLFVRCRVCGLVYLNPQPTPAELEAYYKGDYYAYPPPSSAFRTRVRKAILDSFFRGNPKAARKASPLAKPFLYPVYLMNREYFNKVLPFRGSGRILDVGCGSGYDLDNFRHLGWDCYGVEVSSEARKRAAGKGLKVFQSLEAARFRPGFFDVISLWHTLEHIHEPAGFLRKVRGLLGEDGLLVVHVPNVSSAMHAMFRRSWYGLNPPEHLWQFSPETVRLLLEKEGFAVQKLRYHSSAHGLIGSLDMALNRGNSRVIRVLLDNILTKSLAAPLIWFLDWFCAGDSIEVYAVKEGSR